MAKYDIEDDQGRQLQIEVDGDLTPEIAEQAFSNYDAMSVASAGPRGSEGRRRAQAGVSARNAQQTAADISGGSEAGPVVSGLASLGQAVGEFGNKAIAGAGRVDSMFTDAVVNAIRDPLGDILGRNNRNAADALARSEANPMVRLGTSLSEQGQAFYPVNPKQTAANLVGSSVGSVIGTVASGPLAVPAYAASSFESGLQGALDAGATPEQAINQGFVEAATGAATEGLLGVVPGLHEAKAGAMRGIVRPTLKSTIGEAVQEPLEGTLNRASAKYLTGSDPSANPLDVQTALMEAAGGAIGGVAAGGAFAAANARDRGNRLRAIQEYRSPEATLLRQVENAPLGRPATSSPLGSVNVPDKSSTEDLTPLNFQQSETAAQLPPLDPAQLDGMSSADILGVLQQRLDARRAIFADRIARKSATERRARLEAGLNMPQIQPIETQPEPAIGTYPEGGMGTGVILPAEEAARRAQVRQEASARGQQRAAEGAAENLRQQEEQIWRQLNAEQAANQEAAAQPQPPTQNARVDMRVPAILATLNQRRQEAEIWRQLHAELAANPISTPLLDSHAIQTRANQVAPTGPVSDVQSQPAVGQTEGQAPQGTPLQASANPQVVTQVAPVVSGAVGQDKSSMLTSEERDALAKAPSEDESDAVFNARERAKKKQSRSKQTIVLSKYLSDAGVNSDGLQSGMHLTHVGLNKDGSIEVRVERHKDDGTVSVELVIVRPGDNLNDAISKKFGISSATTQAEGKTPQGTPLQTGANLQVAPVTVAQFVPGGALQAVGGLTVDFGGLKMSVIPSPDDPSIGFVTGLSGSGVAGKLNEIKSALGNAGFKDIQYRPDNEDGRSAARVRLFESLKAKLTTPAAAETGAKGKPVEDYRMQHRPNSEGPQAHDLLSTDLAPRDIYDRPDFYTGEPRSVGYRESVAALRKIRGKPDAEITVYRASPQNTLNDGDWVSFSKSYSKQHGMGDNPSADVPVHAFKVKARDVRWAGDTLEEFGYYPTPTTQPAKARQFHGREVIGDILDDIESQGGLISKTEARKRKLLAPDKNGPEYDDAPTLKQPIHNFIYGNGRGGKGSMTPDRMAKALEMQHPEKYAGLTVSDLWAAIESSSNSRVVTETKMRRMRDQGVAEGKTEDRQQKSFNKATSKSKGGPEGVNVSDLIVGGEVTIGGESFKVADVDPENGDVVLQDGAKFGRRVVEAGKVIYVENVTQPSADDSFNEPDSFSAPPEPTGVRLRKSPLRSKPAAAQSIATSGVGAGVSPAPSPAIEGSVFGVRPYRGAPTITAEVYNRINQAIDAGIESKDPVAQNIRDLDAQAETDIKKSSGYEALSDGGKFDAIQRYRNKLYQSAVKWADTGKFLFDPMVIAKGVTMDVGKSGAEKMAKQTAGEEAVGESGTSTNLTRATTQVLPQTAIEADTNRVKQDAVEVLNQLRARLNLSASELVSIISAYQSDTTGDLNDKELAAFNAVKPTLDKLGAVNFSVSSLIAEPIGQARAQEAVDQWLDSVGNPDLLIRVVDDPNLKTKNGRNVAAQIEFSQGGQPIITINGAQIGSEAEVREKIWHELLHTVWEDPTVQKAWAEVVAKLTEADVQAQLARGYSPQETTMEAAIDKASIRAANTTIRPLWQRFLDSIWQALKAKFGFESKPANFEALMISALRAAAGPWNGQQQSRYNQDVAAMDRPYMEAVARGDMAAAQQMVDAAAKKAGFSTAKQASPASKRNSLRVRLSREALTDLALSQAKWRDWYKEHQDTLDAFFGSDAGLFQKILAITSQASSVKTNVALALKAFAQFKQGLDFDGKTRGEESSGYLSPVIGNLNALRAETQIQGRKIGAYTSANEGKTDSVVVDRHIARMLFGVDTPSAAQYAKASKVLTEIANELGWEPRQVQAALWAASIVKSGKEPQSYGQYLRTLHSRGTLKERIGHVVDGSSEVHGIGGLRGADSGGFQAASGGVKSAEPVTYDNAGNVVLLSQRFNPESKDIRYSVANNLYVTNPERFKRIAEQGQTEAVVAQGQTASAIIPESTLKEIADLEAKPNPTPAEKAAIIQLKAVRNIVGVAVVADQIRQANEGSWPNYRTLDDLPEQYKSVAAQSVMATHLYLNQRYNAIKARQEKAATKISDITSKLDGLNESRLLAHVSNNEADQLLKDLQTMIDLEIGKVGTSAASRTLDELHKASAAVVGLRQKQDAISAALRSIAKDAPMADFASPEAMKSWIESRQADKSKPPLMTDEVATAIRASLKPGSGLPDRLSLIRALMADTAVAKAQIKDLKAKVGNPKTALKTIIALKMDANSVLNQVANLDRSLDQQLVILDGVDAAIGVMDRMQASKQYQARVTSAFQYGGFKYSGIIRYTNKPNGDQTLVGPSGKEYVVNFTPDYAVEKKNLDTIGEWMQETINAINNSGDPKYITDPAKRTSYNNMLAFVSRYMTDRRWLSESAWENSIGVNIISTPLMLLEKVGVLKAVLGDHLDTRFNAYRAMAGRAGSELVKRSRSIDTFGSKTKALTDSMKEPLAVARRKAVDSHGLNPDDASDLAIWNRKINSWILSQNQNPGSTPVKVGDSLGEGITATKEDLAFAEMQHKFSKAVGEIYSGADVEGGIKDPEAPGISPEEQLFGLDFSRKAMQYGYAVGRQFSEAGQEHTREWMAARAKDLAEYKNRVARAAEGEEVPMVWTERSKVAEVDIEGHVYSHIRESSTDYTSTADKTAREAYREIAKAIRRGTHYSTLNEISEALAPLLSTETEEGAVEMGASEAKEILLKALDKDVLNYNRVSELVTHPSNDPTVSDLPKALAAVRSAKGALVKARGKMAAPSFFYDYSLDTDAKRAGMIQMGKQALAISEINAARNMLSAMRARLAEYDAKIEARAQELGRNGKKVGTWSATRELEAKLRKQFKAGELQITYSMLRKMADKLETLAKDREDALGRQRVLEEEAFKVAVLNFTKGAVASVLLSMPAPIINNMTAVVLDPLRAGLMHGNIGFAAALYGKQLGSSVKYVFQRVIYKAAKKLGLFMPRKVQEAIAELSSNLFSDMLTRRQELEDSGILDAAESFSDTWSRYKSNPMSFGDTTRAKETATSRAISSILTSPVLGRGLIPATFEYIRQRFPGSGDRMVNQMNSMIETELSNRIKSKLWLWVNSLEGSTINEKIQSSQSASIKASDIGMSEENLSNYRTTYESTGSLERLAADYYKRNPDGAKGDLLTKAQRETVVFELISLTNKEVDSTRAEITKGGSGVAGVARSSLYLFQRYALQLLGAQKRTFGNKGGAGWQKEFGQAMAYLFMIAMTLFTGAATLPVKQFFKSNIQNEPLTSPTIAQVADNPELVGKYLTAAAGGVMPLGASLVGAAFSGQPLMGPVSANVLDNNPLVGAANNMIGAIQNAYESGDLVYPALDFARKQLWFSQPIVNALMPGDTAAREAKRAVRTGAVGMEVRESGGAPASVKSTPMTPIVRDAVAAIYEKDDVKFQAAKQRGIDYLVGKGLSTKEAEKRFNASVSGRDPFRSVLGHTPTEEQASTIIGRSTSGQASTLQRAREGFNLRKKSKSKGLKLRSSSSRGRKASSLRRARKPARLRKSSLG